MTWENMSELREELDKNGIAWSGDYDDNGDTTAWKSPRGQFFNCGHERFNHDLYLHISPVAAKQAIAVTLGNETTGQDVDGAYRKRIAPRVHKENSPTAAIRKWSVLAHGVMELTGPSPFGMDGSVQLWLHERSLTQLFDMCDEVDERFETLGGGGLTAEQVREAVKRGATFDYGEIGEYVSLENWQAIAEELNAALGDGECHLDETEIYQSEAGTVHVLECSECGHVCEHVNGSYPRCPHCGRKAVER